MKTPVVSIRARWSDLRARLGANDARLYLLHRALQRLSSGRAAIVKYYIVAQPIRLASPLRPDPRTTIEEVGAVHHVVGEFPRPPQVIALRFASGGRCLTATIDGSFAGFLWWQHDRYEEDEVRCLFELGDPERSVWDYDVYVEPQHRLGRCLARLWQSANLKLAVQGVRWSFSRISAFNAASLSAHARLGMVRVGSLTFLKVGNVDWLCSHEGLEVRRSRGLQGRPCVRLEVPKHDMANQDNGAPPPQGASA